MKRQSRHKDAIRRIVDAKVRQNTTKRLLLCIRGIIRVVLKAIYPLLTDEESSNDDSNCKDESVEDNDYGARLSIDSEG